MPTKTGVLLLHGLTGVPSEMRPVEKYLQRLGYEVDAPTLAGHGGSHEELLAVKWTDWVSSAAAALDKLLERVDQAVVCGLSMGGSIGSIVASRNPKVVGVIMLSPTLAYDSPEIDAKWHLKLYGSKLVRDILHSAVQTFPIIGRTLYWTETAPYGLRDERLQRQITKAIEAAKRGEDTKFGLFRTYFGSLSEMNFITDEWKRTAPNVKCPALIVSSLEDTLVSINNPATAFSFFGSEQKSLAMLTGCDHVLTLDLKRNYVCRLVGEFMEAVAGVPSTSTETNSQLTVEVHNRLNPLGTPDWQQYVPGGRTIMDLVPILQEAGVHEGNCLSFVVRFDNEPIMVLPFFRVGRNRATFGIEQKFWSSGTAACSDPAKIEQAWAAVDTITKALCKSYAIQSRDFVDFDNKKIPALAK